MFVCAECCVVLKAVPLLVSRPQRNKVSVGLDARNTGEFSSCISDAELSLPAEWHKKARVGITATTGQGLSDNHDIISLLITSVPLLLLLLLCVCMSAELREHSCVYGSQ